MRVQLKESIKVDNVILPRRAFLEGLISLFAAPAIVKVESLMPVVVWRPTFRRKSRSLTSAHSDYPSPTGSGTAAGLSGPTRAIRCRACT
jgi:hypothetical protein